MLKKLFLQIIFLHCFAMPALAQVVSLKEGAVPALSFKGEGAAYAIFQRSDDLWIVSADKKPLVLASSVRAYKSFIEQEELYVPQGQGVRIGLEGVSGISVQKEGGVYTIALQKTPQAAVIKPFAVNLFEEKGATKLKATIGGGKMLRATSFATGESYLVLTSYLNRGQKRIQTKGDVRQLKAHVGGVFVSAQGLPIGFSEQGEEVTFVPMKNRLSKAVSYSRYHVPASLVEELLDGLGAQTAQVPQERVRTGFDILLPAFSGVHKATYDQALERMQVALKKVSMFKAGFKPGARKQRASTEDVTVPQVAVADFTKKEDEDFNHAENMADMPIAIPVTVPTAEGEALNTTPKPLKADEKLEDKVISFMGFEKIPQEEQPRIEKELKKDWVFAKTRKLKEDAGHRLAAYYIFKGFYPEALGVLKNLTDVDTPKVRTLNAITNTLMGRYKDVTRQIARLKERTPHEALWLAAARVHKTPQTALKMFKEHEALINAYPPALSQVLRYYYAQSLKEGGMLQEALKQLDQIALLGGSGTFLAKAQLLMAQIYHKQAKPNQAEQIYIALASHHNKEISSFALLHFMNLLTDEKQLDVREALVRYENLRFLWRGDKVEEESLFRLADLYAQKADYRLALERLQSLVTHFPKSGYARKATERMTQIFEGVMTGRLQDQNLDTLGFLGLYYDFRELTPTGKAGDGLVVGVADKLAGLGLYKRAIDILEKQLNFRAANPQSIALLGYKLADIYAQSFSPEKGLSILRRTAKRRIPTSLQNKRNLVKGAFYAMLGDMPKAFNAAKKVETEEGKMAQIQYAWEVGDMPHIIKLLIPRFASVGGTDWSQKEATEFMALASALAVQRNYKKLEELYHNYRPGLATFNLESDVLFFLQSANKVVDVPIDRARTGKGFWSGAAVTLNMQNMFNRNYRMLKKQWEEQNIKIRASEKKAFEERLRGLQ